MQNLLARAAPALALAGAALLLAGLLLHPVAGLREAADPFEVVISRAQVNEAVDAAIKENPALAAQRDAEYSQLQSEAEAHALLVAEAFAQGLPASDYIVRNRLVELQVMALYEQADAEITPDAAAQYFAAHRERYRSRPRRLYLHLYVPVTNRVLDAEARRRLEMLRRDPAAWGKPKWVYEDELRQAYGPTLARLAFELPRGQWSDAYRSDLGWHYLEVEDEEAERALDLEEVRARVTEDCRREKRQRFYDDEIARLRQKYRIRVTD